MSTETVPKGYKRTEVGVIPEEWDDDFIEAHCEITTGSRNTQDRVNDGLYPFFVRSQTIERINSYSFDGEAVLTAGDGVGTGKVFHYINGRFDAHQRVYKISHFDTQLSGKYFYLYFSNHFYSRIMQMTAKSSVDSVRREMIAKMRIPLPPRIEQQAIAAALSDAEALIESLEQLLAKKRQIKQGAMQELLTGKRRLPGFEIVPGFKQTEIGTIPEDWKLIAVGEIAKIGRGRVISHKEIAKSTNSMYPVYSSQTSNNGVMGYLDNFDFDGEYVTWTTDGANAGTVFYRSGKFNCTNVCGTIKLESDDPRFVSLALGIRTYGYVSRQLGNPKLMNDVLKQVKVSMPSLPEQTAIATVLSDMDAELEVLEGKLDKARQVKQGMMQQLLTGKVRLV